MTTTDPETLEQSQLTTQWTRIRGRLQAEVGDVEYRTWLRQMTLGALDGDELTIYLPTRFLRDWVSTRYGDRLRALWQAESRSVRRVDIRVGEANGTATALAAPLVADPLPSHPSAGQRDGATASGPSTPRTPAQRSPGNRSARQGDGGAPPPMSTPGWSEERIVESRSDLQPRFQSAVPVWRRRPGQDPPDALHRVGTDGLH